MSTDEATKQQLGGKTTQGDRGDAKAQPSGPKGDNPATGGRGETKTKSATPENASGKLNPAAPGNTGTTPGTNVEVG